MEQVAQKIAVYKAICGVTKALSVIGISKDRTNTQGAGFKFRGIDDVYNALSSLLPEHGLMILPRMISREFRLAESAKGGNLHYVTLCAEFDFVSAEDGSIHTVRTYGEAMDSGDKATNKAMSAAYKYACIQAFCIPTASESPDADAQTHEVKVAAKPKAKPVDFDTARAAALAEINACADVDALVDLDAKYRPRLEKYKNGTEEAQAFANLIITAIQSRHTVLQMEESQMPIIY